MRTINYSLRVILDFHWLQEGCVWDRRKATMAVRQGLVLCWNTGSEPPESLSDRQLLPGQYPTPQGGGRHWGELEPCVSLP